MTNLSKILKIYNNQKMKIYMDLKTTYTIVFMNRNKLMLISLNKKINRTNLKLSKVKILIQILRNYLVTRKLLPVKRKFKILIPAKILRQRMQSRESQKGNRSPATIKLQYEKMKIEIQILPEIPRWKMWSQVKQI